MLFMLSARVALGQVYVNGTMAGYDRLTNTFLATIPQEKWGKECQVYVTVSDSVCWENTEARYKTESISRTSQLHP